ncbi:MAG TPA: hypothetical protein VE053_01200 [Allosphingosinicella sp.]|nr:hypothetical protein [Allosphingosinicella sp.]
MHQDNKAEQTPEIEFEPSHLVEYGEARERTQGGGGPAAQPDGAVYNS